MATFFNLDPRVVLAIGAALVLLGLALAFWGRGIWRRIMALIGMVLGGIIGFIAGYAIGGFTVGGYTISPYVLGLILSLIGALIGTLLFAKLVNIALALVIGLAAAALVFFSLGASTGTATLADARVIGAIIAFVVVFALSYYFIEELLAILTAAIGGALLGFGVYILLWPGGRVLQGDEALREHPRQIPAEHVVVHVRRDLETGLDHGPVLPPQPLEEASEDVEVRTVQRGASRHDGSQVPEELIHRGANAVESTIPVR